MGIRVHKFMGYGLDDVKPNDERFVTQPSYSLFDKLSEEENQKAFVDHLLNLDKQEEHLRGTFKDYYHLYDLQREKAPITVEAHDFIAYDDEYGLKNVFVIKPIFGFKDWTRYDDTIDHHILPQKNDVQVQRWHCLYPFLGFVDAQTGTTFDDKIFSSIRHINRSIEEGNNPDAPYNSWDSLYEGSSKKYATFKEYEQYVYPVKPRSIVEYAKFFNLFKDENTVHTLKPMIYTYWG